MHTSSGINDFRQAGPGEGATGMRGASSRANTASLSGGLSDKPRIYKWCGTGIWVACVGQGTDKLFGFGSCPKSAYRNLVTASEW